MWRLLLAAVLVIGLAAPGFAGSVLMVNISTAGSTTTVKLDGQVFASGPSSCSSSCTWTVANKSVTVTSTMVSSLTSTAEGWTGLAAAFPTHGAWVSAVAHWANTNPMLTGRDVGQIVSEAASTHADLVSHGADPGHGGGHGGR